MKNGQLINTLNTCIDHCTYCADACLDEKDIKMMVPCIRLDQACAAVCDTVKKLLISNHSAMEGLLQYCIQICEACAKECEKHEMQHCKDCAKACQDCADACRAFLN